MFKIGEFSKLSQVTVKTLRYYDEVGLFQPAHIDNFTGYRYYSADQMSRLNKILALKNLGFALEQIGLMMDLQAADIKKILEKKRLQIQQQLRCEREKMALVDARIKQIEEGDVRMFDYDVVIKKIDKQQVIALRETISTYYHIGEQFEKLCKTIRVEGIKTTGSAISICYDGEYREHDVDIEVAVPVVSSAQKVGNYEIKELPAVEKVACVIHQGSYETMHIAYGVLMNWIEKNNYRITGPDRDVYLRPHDQCAEGEVCITEIQIPVSMV